MKFNFFIILIIVFLFKTENILSNDGIFNVNNIEIDLKKFKKNKNYIDSAFKKGFEDLTTRILLEKDHVKVSDTNIEIIKDLISHYQISDKLDGKKDEIIKINIFFDKKKINNFFLKNDISYSDFTKRSIILFPLLINNENFFIYDDNYFYTAWNNLSTKENNLIEYILPIENLENFKKVKNNYNNIENIKILDLVSDYENDNYSLVIVNEFPKYANVLIKCLILDQSVTRNFTIKQNDFKKDDFYNQIILKARKQILEIIKSQNTVDLQTPSFLNLKLRMDKRDDLLKLQSILEKIDLIDKFSVVQFNKNEVKIKIKYYGKIKSISEKLKKNGINIIISDNQWDIKLT